MIFLRAEKDTIRFTIPQNFNHKEPLIHLIERNKFDNEIMK